MERNYSFTTPPITTVICHNLTEIMSYSGANLSVTLGQFQFDFIRKARRMFQHHSTCACLEHSDFCEIFNKSLKNFHFQDSMAYVTFLNYPSRRFNFRTCITLICIQKQLCQMLVVLTRIPILQFPNTI